MTEPEFYDRLVTAFPYIDAQRLYWSSLDVDYIINKYASLGFDGASMFIEDYVIGESKTKKARVFVAEFRRKHLSDPRSYTIYQLIRTLFLNQIASVVSASPIGPKTKVHSVREVSEIENQYID